MAFSEPEPRMLQLFEIKNGRTNLKQEVLDSLCAQCGDRSVSVISTAGKSRQGKSFLTNVTLKGLQRGRAEFDPEDFVGGPGGVEFQRGYSPHTKGIMGWSKVFYRQNEDGNELAVILMDTQGTFDTCSDPTDSAIIFAISLLMSSIKIYNTKSQMDTQDLDALNMFIAFSQEKKERVGQHFLIIYRDSIDSGFKPEHLNEMRENTRKVPKLARLYNGVFEAFERVECFMVPRPSDEVIKASGKIFAKDCGDDFLSNLCKCANHVLDNLTPKMVMGIPLTGSTLGAHVKNLVNHINTNSHNAICSAFQATSELFFEKARTAGKEIFAKRHEELVCNHGHRPIRPQDYEDALRNFIQHAIEAYESNQPCVSAEEKSGHFEKFLGELEERCQEKISSNKDRYREWQMAEAVNGAYEVYEKGMKSLEKTRKVGFVKERHEEAFPEAMKHFDDVVQDFLDEPDLIENKRKLLNEMIQARFEELQQDKDIPHLHQRVDEMFQELVEEHQRALKQQVATIKDESKIKEAIDFCQNLLWGKYEIKKAELVAEVAIALPKISSEMVEHLLDNCRDSQSTKFKRCEDSFEMEVRHNLKIDLLNEKMESLGMKQEEEKRRSELLKEELVEERRRRAEAESDKIWNRVFGTVNSLAQAGDTLATVVGAFRRK